MAATRDDRKTTPLPAAREAIVLDCSYSAHEFALIKNGLSPREMEDKWFIFFEEPYLYVHRSWTGYCVFQVRFEPVGEDARVGETLVSRDSAQYGETDGASDALLLAILLGELVGRDTDELWTQYEARWGFDHDGD